MLCIYRFVCVHSLKYHTKRKRRERNRNSQCASSSWIRGSVCGRRSFRFYLVSHELFFVCVRVCELPIYLCESVVSACLYGLEYQSTAYKCARIFNAHRAAWALISIGHQTYGARNFCCNGA